MFTFSLQLISLRGSHGNKNELPYGPRAHICVKGSSEVKYPTKKGIMPFAALSHECTGFQELEAEADRLVEELRKIKKQGMRFFEKELGR